MIRVDAHHHVWTMARGDYRWMSPELPIARDYGLDDLRPLLGDVTATVLVQAADTEAETAFMLEVARGSAGLVRGVVGWTDLASSRASTRIAELAGEPMLKGLRPMLQDIEDTEWILLPAVQPALAAMARHGLRFDALLKPRHLPLMAELARRHPDLAVVIDHAAKPDIANQSFKPWANHMTRLARETSWCCKVSGLVTEAKADWQIDDLRPYVDHLLETFGPDRLMWGSDWPVVTLASNYRRWHDTAATLLPADTHDAVFGGTAQRFYGLDSSTQIPLPRLGER
jgi:L-fuconolactonase